MLDRFKLRYKILIPVGLVSVIIFGLIMFLVQIQIKEKAVQDISNLSLEISQRYANMVKGELDAAIGAAKAMAAAVANERSQYTPERSVVTGLLRKCSFSASRRRWTIHKKLACNAPISSSRVGSSAKGALRFPRSVISFIVWVSSVSGRETRQGSCHEKPHPHTIARPPGRRSPRWPKSSSKPRPSSTCISASASRCRPVFGANTSA